jgi:hypothetical protein
MTNSGLEPLQAMLSTSPPFLIRVSPTGSEGYLLWEFLYPSALRVTAELSASQSSTMAADVASTSDRVRTVPIGCSWPDLLSPPTGQAAPAATVR